VDVISRKKKKRVGRLWDVPFARGEYMYLRNFRGQSARPYLAENRINLVVFLLKNSEWDPS